jgi:hypothetical protein
LSRDHERELLASFYHCWCPGGGGVFLSSHNKIHDTQATYFDVTMFFPDCWGDLMNRYGVSNLDQKRTDRVNDPGWTRGDLYCHESSHRD